MFTLDNLAEIKQYESELFFFLLGQLSAFLTFPLLVPFSKTLNFSAWSSVLLVSMRFSLSFVSRVVSKRSDFGQRFFSLVNVNWLASLASMQLPVIITALSCR